MGKLNLYIILFIATLATYFIYDYIKYKNLQAAILELSIEQPDLLDAIMHRNCNEVEKNIRSVSKTREFLKTNQLVDESLADLYTVIHTDTSVIGGFKLSKKNTILLEKPAGDLFADKISYKDYFNNDFIVLYELRFSGL